MALRVEMLAPTHCHMYPHVKVDVDAVIQFLKLIKPISCHRKPSTKLMRHEINYLIPSFFFKHK
jgi:hypothetical protein